MKHDGGNSKAINKEYKRKKNLKGIKFGRLLVIEEAESFMGKNGEVQCAGWLCRCDCGNKVVIRSNSLRMGATKSCGCLNREKPSNNIKHHMSGTKLYYVWKEIKSRCLRENDDKYKYYGGRGIKVCKEWLDDFMNFYNWAMSNGYREGLTIERKNVDGDYCPVNCEWIPFEKQSFNKTNTIRDSNNASIAEMAREVGIVSPQIARDRYKSGWSLHDAISIPKMKAGERYEKS